jgi:hypothetical protein
LTNLSVITLEKAGKEDAEARRKKRPGLAKTI